MTIYLRRQWKVISSLRFPAKISDVNILFCKLNYNSYNFNDTIFEHKRTAGMSSKVIVFFIMR